MRSPEHDVTNQNVSNFTMLIRKPRDIKPSEITDKGIYLKRREFIKTAAALSAAAVTGCGPDSPPATHGSKLATVGGSSFSTSEELTPYKDVTTYNNFYDFGTQKTDPAQYSRNFTTRPWTVAIDGQVNKPNTYDIDELWKLAPLEERVYRLRCIEAWSMVVPWIGYSLSELIKQVEPTSRAKYVEFTTLLDIRQMPGQRRDARPVQAALASAGTFSVGAVLPLNTHEDLKLALIEGAVLRVRPKAMTVAVIIAGLLPIMFGGGTGSEVMQRIAAPMVGGMITAPFLSVFVFPAAYLLVLGRQLEGSA